MRRAAPPPAAAAVTAASPAPAAAAAGVVAPIQLKVRELKRTEGKLQTRTNSFEGRRAEEQRPEPPAGVDVQPAACSNNRTSAEPKSDREEVATSAPSGRPNAVLTAANNIEGLLRKNSVESAVDAQKLAATKVSTPDVKKEKAVPPPRKSSDPTNKSHPTTAGAPPQPVAKEASAPAPVKVESPLLKHKASNGTITQNVQASLPTPQPTRQAQVTSAALEISKTNKEQTQPNETSRPPKDTSLESNGVGDKIRKFERAAEDATGGSVSRSSSIRAVKSDVQEKGTPEAPDPSAPASVNKAQTAKAVNADKLFSPESFVKWRKNGSETPIAAVKNAAVKLERKEIKTTIKFNKFPQNLPVQFTSGAIFADRKPSTAASDTASLTQPQAVHRMIVRKEMEQSNEDGATQAFKSCKFKPKEKTHAPHKAPSSYFTRGTEEMWLVKKKDIEAIEDRVMESFRRAGVGSCRSEPVRETSEDSQRRTLAGSSATLGRAKRTAYGRSESLDPQHAAARSQTLKRQSSVACTCGQDKTRAKGAAPACEGSGPPRPRSRSHGDDNAQGHVLDKYETLV